MLVLIIYTYHMCNQIYATNFCDFLRQGDGFLWGLFGHITLQALGQANDYFGASKMRSGASEAVIKADTMRFNYLSLPLIPASGTTLLKCSGRMSMKLRWHQTKTKHNKASIVLIFTGIYCTLLATGAKISNSNSNQFIAIHISRYKRIQVQFFKIHFRINHLLE